VLLRIDRLPRIGERAGPGLAFGNLREYRWRSWDGLACWRKHRANKTRFTVTNSPPTKFLKTGFRRLFKTARSQATGLSKTSLYRTERAKQDGKYALCPHRQASRRHRAGGGDIVFAATGSRRPASMRSPKSVGPPKGFASTTTFPEARTRSPRPRCVSPAPAWVATLEKLENEHDSAGVHDPGQAAGRLDGQSGFRDGFARSRTTLLESAPQSAEHGRRWPRGVCRLGAR